MAAAQGFDRFHFAYIPTIANLTLDRGLLLLVVHAWRLVGEIERPTGRPDHRAHRNIRTVERPPLMTNVHAARSDAVSLELRGKARRHLRSLGNPLRPTVYLGKEGISPALLRSIDEGHAHHELIKVTIERGCPLDRKEAGDHLAVATESHLVQVLGNTLLLYRPDPDEPKIVLPD